MDLKKFKFRFCYLLKWKYLFIVFFLQILFFAGTLSASPNYLTLQSRIVQPNGHNLEAASVNYRFSITDPVGTCVVYQEDFSNVNMVDSKGLVAIKIGSGTRGYPVAATTMKDIFTNFNSPVFNCQAGGTYTAASSDQRKIVMQFNDGSGWQTVPSLEINSTPFSLESLSAQKLGLFPAGDYVRSAQFATCVGGEAVHFNGTNFTCVTLGGAATSVAAAAGLAGTPSISFSGDTNTGLYSGAADTISISNNGSNTFNITSTALSSTTTGGATITQTNGTAAAPTFSFAGDADTGWYRAAADTLAASTAGAERIRIDSSGNVGVGTTSPTSLLHVVGTNVSSPLALANILTVTGAGNTGAGAGSGINMTAGSSASGAGGSIGLVGGSWSGIAGASLSLAGSNWGGGGGISLTAGQNSGGGAGAINITGADGTGVGTLGGPVNIRSGHSYNNGGVGGALTLTAGSGTAGNADGGALTLLGGDKAGSGIAGNVLLATTRGNVGIGTASPNGKLEVSNGSGSYVRFDVGNPGMLFNKSNNVSGSWGLHQGWWDGQDLTFLYNGSNPVISMRPGGNIGIGTASPQTKLQVEGIISPATNNAYTLGNASYRFTEVYATNGVINTSDRREKKDIFNTDLGLDFINKLRPVSYRWNTGVDNDVHYGLIAQEAEQALVESGRPGKTSIVSHDEVTDRYGVRYSELISPLIKAVQEFYSRFVSVESRQSHQDREIASLKTENAAMKARLDKIEKAIAPK